MPEPLAVIKHRIGEVHNMQEQTRAVEQKIFDSSRKRLEQVQADIDKLRPRANIDSDAGEKHLDLCLERGRLEQVIANSEARL